MELRNAAGDFLKLTLVGYQFPNRVPDSQYDYDANWLMVRLDAELDGRAWRAQDPCLTTWEVTRLANWLEQLHFGQPLSYPRMSFTEPLLDFKPMALQSAEASLRIYIDAEFRPMWLPGHGVG